MSKRQPRTVRGEDLVAVETAARNFITLMREFRPASIEDPYTSGGNWVAFVCSGSYMAAQLNAAMDELECAVSRVPSLTDQLPRPG